MEKRERSTLADELIVRSITEWQALAHSMRLLLVALPTIYLALSVAYQGRAKRSLGEFINSDGNHILGCCWIILAVSLLLAVVALYTYFRHLALIVANDDPQIYVVMTSRWRIISDICAVSSSVALLLGVALSVTAAIIQKEIF